MNRTETEKGSGDQKRSKRDDALIITNLRTKLADANLEILTGLNLKVLSGEVHVIMGPNGSGKSTLAKALMGHPKYAVTDGQVTYRGKNVLELAPDERAKLGIFLGFQYPEEVPGVTIENFLRISLNSVMKEKIPLLMFRKLMKEKLKAFGMEESFAQRYLNDGFSGGEKKRTEILQMAVLQPKMVILDEIDSGTDIDALRIIAEGINKLISKERSFIIITHYQRILQYLKQIDYVHIMIKGKIVKTGDQSLAEKLEREGYGWITKE